MSTVSMERFRDTALNTALRKGDHRTAEELIADAKTDINEKGAGGLTPLIWASSYGYESLVNMMINRRVEINDRDDEKHSALDYAKLYKLSMGGVYNRIVDTLIKNGAEEKNDSTIQLRLDNTEPLLLLGKPSEIVIIREIKVNGGHIQSLLHVSNAVEIRKVKP